MTIKELVDVLMQFKPDEKLVVVMGSLYVVCGTSILGTINIEKGEVVKSALHS